jgi:hypothetical protein
MRLTALVVAFMTTACGAEQALEDEVPPAEPTHACGDSPMETFAIDSIDLGESDWQTVGYDLDGKITTKDSVDVCTFGGSRVGQADGDRGIDNAFGELMMPTLENALQDPTPSIAMTSAIASGRFTLQIQVTKLDDTPTQTCRGLYAQVFASDRYDATSAVPAFDETTDWPVMAESLVDPSTVIGGALAAFADGYVQAGTVVLGADGGVTVPLHLVLENGNALDVRVHQALITFDHVTAPEAAHGVLAGVLDPDEIMVAAEVGFPFPKACCGTACGQGWASIFHSWSDIGADRTNTPGVACNAISFAIGFHAKRVTNPTRVAAPLPAPPPPCP